ncbi:hypothetical protein GY45DRAFT_411925 [Cubamyces sp. BRFM 1775]|nr:hypothetical protein GY45DRAFT_411925 [Cubamyces sp. BRFM 1775]
MSPAPPLAVGPAPTDVVPPEFAGYEHILTGYRHQDFPDLSSRRFAPGTLQSTSHAISLDAGHNSIQALAIVAVALGRVLGAYCGCADVLLAIADDPEEKLLPVRVAWGDGQTWSDVLGGVAQALVDPSWPRITPDTLRGALDITPKQSPCLALLSARPLQSPKLGDGIPLVLAIDRDKAILSATASERLCHPSQSQLLLSQVAALVAHAHTAPQTPVASLPQLPSDLLSSYDKHSFEECCGIYGRVPPVRLATDHLTLQAAQQPNNIAVRWYADLSTDWPEDAYTPETISYFELNRWANQLARWLRQAGVESGNSVAVCMKRDVWFHICFVGILRSGACYVPIDAELPLERQQFIAKDSNARYILSTSDLACFESLGNIAIDMRDSSVRAAIEHQDADEVAFAQPDDTSYILYTSGTTGTPKGCILTQRGLSEAIWAISAIAASIVELEDPSEGNYLSIASVAFDVHLAEILVPLALGIPILAAPRSLLLEDLPYYIKNLRVSHVGIVPSLIEATMGAVQEDEESGHATTLRYIASGGEKMSDAILDKWASHPKVRLANFYGPSEVTIGCAARPMDKDTPRANIGRTFANVGAYVVDENMNIVLRGGTGELVVEGPLVGRGYVGRPDLTQKVFLPFPRGGDSNSKSGGAPQRWAYRTGDLVRMMPDATLEIIGRIDTQIKLRGVRIESEGISSILRAAAAPEHALDAMTILAKHSAIGADQLVSFVAWDPSVPVAVRKGGTPSLVTPPEGLLQRLRSACDRELASYMRPSHIVPLSFIPLSSNGKADAKVLAAFFLGLDLETLTRLMADGRVGGSAASSARREPTETERRLLDIMRPYVKMSMDHLGPHTNVFECGMDSLAVARFAAELRRTFGGQVAPAQIMQGPTVSEIAQLLERTPAGHAARQGSLMLDEFASSVREEVEAAYPAESIEALLPPFPVQEGVLYRSANAPSMYVQHVLLRLGPETSVERLRDAWKELVAHHEMLRTVFHFGSNLVQVVLRPDAVQPQFVQHEHNVDDDRAFQSYFNDEKAQSIARELNTAISKEPPVRLTVYTNAASRGDYLILSIHHALYDGISLPVLLRDFERVYTGQRELPHAPLRAILEQIVTIDHTAARAFWREHLQGYPWQRLLRKTASSSHADIASLAFGRSLSELQAKAASQQVTLQALLMGAYGRLLGERVYGGQDDVVFGVIRAGRSLPVTDIDTTVCPMITVVPARVGHGARAQGVLHAIQRDVARASEHEHIPLSRIQKWIPECKGALFDTLFSVSFKEHDASRLWTVVESQNPEPDYILAVEVVLDPAQDRAVVNAAYTSADISPEVVKGILRDLEETAMRLAEGKSTGTPANGAGASYVASQETASTSERLRDHDVGLPEDADVDEKIVSAIIHIASKFLRVDAGLITSGTSLLSLGLDSIKSVGLSRKLSAEGLRLSSADIMGLSTPRRLAARVQKAREPQKQGDDYALAAFKAECEQLAAAVDIEALKLSASDVVQVFPTTTLQAGMLSQTVSSDGRLYVHLFPLRLDEGVDIDRLRGAWQQAIELFDILRTSFHFLPSRGVWVQAVHSNAVLHWSEASYVVGVNLVEALNPYLQATDEHEIFREPPVFLNLLKAQTPGVPDRLVVVLHHALYDGLSIATLLHTVQQLYDGVKIPAPQRYHDLLPHLFWQEKNGTEFWVNRLRNLRNAPIPKNSATSASTTVHQISRPVQLSNEEIRRACREAEVTAQCLGQTAFAKLLAVVTRSSDVVFGRVVSGRDIPGAEDVIGPMLNTVPCRVMFTGETTNKELLKHVHKANVDSMAWQHASLRSIQRQLGVSSLWDSIFVFQPRQESLEAETNSLWTFDVEDVEQISVQYPLNVELHEESNGFVIKAAWTSDVANAEQLSEWVDRYAHILSQIARHMDEPWRYSIPEVPALQTYGVREDKKAVKDESAEEWDPRFVAFREVVAAVANVSISMVHPGTPLATLGVDSITAVQLVAKARRAGLRLTSSDVVQSRTVGALLHKLKENKASVVNGKPSGNPGLVSVDIPRERWSALLSADNLIDVGLVERITRAPPGMEWMIGMWQRSGGSRFQHVFGYRLPGNVDTAKIQTAWSELTKRHAVLRSTFVYDREAAAPRLVVFKPDALDQCWSQEFLDVPAAQAQGAVIERMKALVSHPPPVSRPFTRAVLLQSPDSSCLLVHLHHFQYDAWSLHLLADDLARLYLGQEPKSSNDLDGFLRSISFDRATTTQQEKYWRDMFSVEQQPALFPSLPEAPEDLKRGVYTDHSAISGAAAIEKRARELSVSLQSVFLACWAQVQSKYTRSGDATFSLWHSGRTGEVQDAERLALPCINALPYCARGVEGVDTLNLARRIQEDLQARPASIEQSRLASVHDWVGIVDRPLSNVYVNIIKVAPDVGKDESALLEAIEAPYYIPDVSPEATNGVDTMRVTELLRDDVMIDIVVVEKTDSVVMSIEFAGSVLDLKTAKSLVEEWGSLVKTCLQ